MTDLVLASPPLSMAARYGRLRMAGSTLPGLGILYLAGAARRAGFSVGIVEASSLGLSDAETANRIVGMRPRLVGLSATTIGIVAAGRLAATIKAADSSIRVIIGGPHATALPEQTLGEFPCVDAVAMGEGEETVVELLAALREQGELAAVPGTVVRNAGGDLRRGPVRKALEDLDLLPLPAWDLLPGFPMGYSPPGMRVRRVPAASLTTSRGCPYTCAFCDRSVFGRKVRSLGTEHLLGLVQRLRGYGVREVLFEDDTFTASRRRVLAFCEALLASGMELSWSCLARASHVDAELLALMRRAGCWQVSYGIESGDEEIRRQMGKDMDPDEVRCGLQLTREAGIRAKGFFILGFPGESTASLARTADLALSLPLDDISISMFTPFPGSPIYERLLKHGTAVPDWERMSLLNAVFVPSGMTATELASAHSGLLRRFYLRPGIVAGHALDVARHPRTLPAVARGLAGFLSAAFGR